MVKHGPPPHVNRINAAHVRSAAARLDGSIVRDEFVCDRKSQYGTKSRAKEYAAILTRRFGDKMYPYECPACGQWHLTTMRPEEYRARVRGE